MDFDEREQEASRKQIWTRMEMEDRSPPKLVVGLKLISNQPRKYVTNPKFRKLNLLQELTIPREQTIRESLVQTVDTQRHLP